MRNRVLIALAAALMVAAALIWRWQQRSIAVVRAQLAAHRQSAAAAFPPERAAPESHQQAHPSPELLRLRGEVASLRRELEAAQDAAATDAASSNDWQLVYSGPRPSDHPDFVSFANLSPESFATPEAAFQSFNRVMQSKEQLTDTRMKDFWDLPDDFDQPPGYNLHLGEGFYGGAGYRIVNREILTSNSVRLTIDYEKEDGSSYRREKMLVARGGHWRLQPAGVTRAGEPVGNGR